MTVAVTTTRWEANGDGSTLGPFSYDNVIYADTDMKVYVDGALQTLTTHYTISGVGVATGGAVTFVAGSAPASGTKNVIQESDIPAKQTADYIDNDSLPAETTETVLDRMFRVLQQVALKVTRSMTQDVTDSDAIGALPAKADRLGMVLGFDSTDGDPIAVSGTLATSLVSSFMEPVLLAADAAALRALVGLDILDFLMRAGYGADFGGEDLAVQVYEEFDLPRDTTFTGEIGSITTAPVGSAAIFDVELNGVSIYSTTPRYADGATALTAGVLSTTVGLAGDKITYKCLQIGSGTAGQKARLTLKGKLT